MEKNKRTKNTNNIAQFYLSMPNAKQAELVVLGTIMTFPSCILGHVDKLVSEYFYFPQHRIIVDAIRELVFKNIPPEIYLVMEEIKEKGLLSDVGELAGLNEILQHYSTSLNIVNYLDEVKKYWELRLIVQTCSEIAAKGKSVETKDIQGFLTDAEMAFVKLAQSRVKSGLVASSEVVDTTMRQLDEISKNGGMTGISSGFIDLDKVTSGFQKSDLIVLAARPAMGKTSLALNFAANAAFYHQKVVAFFSLEMSNVQLMQRLLSSVCKIESNKFRNGLFSSKELDSLYGNLPTFYTDKLLLDDTPGLNVIDLVSRCRKIVREKGSLDLIVIDYLQLLTAGKLAEKNSMREREISIISQSLKNLAKELNCPVIALAQLNRGLEQRPDKRPRPSDLRESGSIEQDADQIMFVYRDEVYNKDSPDKGIAELIIGKNRHGSLETIKLAFQSEFTSFHNLAKFQ